MLDVLLLCVWESAAVMQFKSVYVGELEGRNAAAVLGGHITEERAIDIFRRYTLPWDEAEALHGLGRALLAAGEQDRGNERLNAAIDIYRRHGAGQRWIDFVEREKATA